MMQSTAAGAIARLRSAPRLSALVLFAAALQLAACARPASEPATLVAAAPSSPDVVARFDGREFTRAQLDALVIGLAPSDRPAPGADLEAWYREKIRELVLDEHLLSEARGSGLHEEQAFKRGLAQVRGQLQVELCLQHQAGTLPALTREDVEAEFERHRDALARPERRLTLHLYRRIDDAAQRDAAVQALTALRDQVLNGDDFGRLARLHSESESRHRGGELGWLLREELPEQLASLVFSLTEGVPSEPVVASDGAHLFYVQSISPARSATLAEAMPMLRERLRAQRIEALIEPLAEQDGRDLGMPAESRFAEIVRAGDSDAVLLAHGGFTLTLGDLRRQLGRISEQGRGAADASSSVPLQSAWRLLQTLHTRERFRAVCEANGWIDADALSERLDRWQSQRLVELQRRQVLRAQAERSESRLLQYYEQNIEQFTPQVLWNLQRLSIPLGTDAAGVMLALEQAVRARTQSIGELQARFGGELRSPDAQSLADLRAIAPMLPGLVAPLQPGQLAPPFRTESHIEVFALASKDQSQPPAFDAVKAQVVALYARHHAAELYERFAEELFAQRPLEVFDASLAAVVEAGLPQVEVSVEELEQLLESL